MRTYPAGEKEYYLTEMNLTEEKKLTNKTKRRRYCTSEPLEKLDEIHSNHLAEYMFMF